MTPGRWVNSQSLNLLGYEMGTALPCLPHGGHPFFQVRRTKPVSAQCQALLQGLGVPPNAQRQLLLSWFKTPVKVTPRAVQTPQNRGTGTSWTPAPGSESPLHSRELVTLSKSCPCFLASEASSVPGEDTRIPRGGLMEAEWEGSGGTYPVSSLRA